MTQRFDIVIDSFLPSKPAEFRAAVLPGYAVRPLDEEEIADLASQELSPETDSSVAVDGPGPTIWFQKPAELTNQRNRIHLDLCGTPREKEVDRPLVLGT